MTTTLRSAAAAYREERAKSQATDNHPVDFYLVICQDYCKETMRKNLRMRESLFTSFRPKGTKVLFLLRPSLQEALRDAGIASSEIFGVVISTFTENAVGVIMMDIPEKWPAARKVCEVAGFAMADHLKTIQAFPSGCVGMPAHLFAPKMRPIVVGCTHKLPMECIWCQPSPPGMSLEKVLEFGMVDLTEV